MTKNDRTGSIRIFLAVCNARSFAAAAVQLHLTPSAVAKAIARLETRLGVRLIERTTRRLQLTQEGERYFKSCSQALNEIDRIEAELAATRSEPSGLVRISMPPLFGRSIVAPALFALADVHPLLSFDITLKGEIADFVAQQVDVAVRIGHLEDTSGLTARRLGTQTIVLCASTAYLDRHGVPQSLSDLAAHRLIATSGEKGVVPWSINASGATGADGRVETWVPPARLLLDGSALTLAAIKAGHGIGLLPQWLAAPEIASGALKQVMPGRIGSDLPIHVVWPSAPLMLPRLRVTIDAIVAATRRSVIWDGAGEARPV
ncbi:LysR family transcriptional regulator [Pararhizobium qamdonense]|uniref:LysR family transcriptional regulator n=1 Tax=Pararhizobium qamdonense TaxID=3031126 RepID=UPI0023E11058|nr:LysR family transcriptional regulator [Pararhizobium qamdonense]